MSEYQVLNTRAPRLDGPVKATGKAKYADDLSMPGMLYGAILQSPLAHAKILHIDTSRALKLPGVKAVVTAKEAGLVKYGVSPARYDETLYAFDKVRYVGDEIAAVAAVDPAIAQEALELIKVDYEELPAVFDMFEAQKEGAPQIHAEFPGNLTAEVHQEFGDTEAVLASCDLVVDHTFLNKRQDAAFIEPHSCLAVFDLDGRLTLHTSTQVPHYVMRTVAMVLQMPVGNVRVMKPYVGGGFGPKCEATPLEMSAALLARQTGKPVKITYSREQVFLHSRARHQFYAEMSLGVMKDGTMVALKNKAGTGRWSVHELRHCHGLLFGLAPGRSVQAQGHEVRRVPGLHQQARVRRATGTRRCGTSCSLRAAPGQNRPETGDRPHGDAAQEHHDHGRHDRQ